MREIKKDFAELPYESWGQSTGHGQQTEVNRQHDTRLQCEQCGQRHMRKVEMIVAEGTRVGESVGPRYTVHYHSQNQLASSYAVSPSLLTRLLIWAYSALFVVGGQFVSTVFLWPENWSWYVEMLRFGLSGGLLCGIYYAILRFGFPGFYSRLISDHEGTIQALADYQLTWVCMDCGHTQVVRTL